MRQGITEEVNVTKNNRIYDGYRLTAHCDVHPDNPDRALSGSFLVEELLVVKKIGFVRVTHPNDLSFNG